MSSAVIQVFNTYSNSVSNSSSRTFCQDRYQCIVVINAIKCGKYFIFDEFLVNYKNYVQMTDRLG